MSQPGAERYGTMPGLVTGISRDSVRPIVDGIVSGIPRKPRPALGTPLSAAAPSATKVPAAAFGSGMFGEGAGPAKGEARKPSKK